MSRRRSRRSSRDVKRDLRAIYTGTDGTIPDLTKLSYKHRSKFTSFLWKMIALFFGLSLIAWSGFFLFHQGLFQSDETLQVTIEGPETIQSGEPVSYTVRYENAGDVPIASLELKLNIPQSFHTLSVTPEATSEQQWTIGSLSSGSDGAITINGVFLSEVPSSQRLQALFTYKPANFSSDFQDIETKTIQIESSVLKLSVSGPEKALAGDTVEYTLNLQNTGKVDVFNVRVFPILPENFTMSGSEPLFTEAQSYWTIDLLKAGDLKELTFTGTFTTTASGEQTVGARAGFVKEELVLEQARQTLITDVLGGALSFHLIIDGSDGNQTVTSGKTLRGSIDFSNNGSDVAEDVRFTLAVNTAARTAPIDFSRALLSNGTRTNATIVWTKEKTTALARLEPKATGVIDFSLPILETLTSEHADTFTITLSAEIGRVGSITSARTIEATPIVISVNSNARTTAQARYFTEDGEAIGSGPLPPVVGKTTHVRIFWTIENSLHALKDVECSTILPPDVAFDEKIHTDIGTLSFHATTRQVRWTIPKLPVDIAQAQAWFDVGFTPDAQDVGSFFKLTNQMTFEAKDATTGDELNKSLDQLTTDFSADADARGKGIVSN